MFPYIFNKYLPMTLEMESSRRVDMPKHLIHPSEKLNNLLHQVFLSYRKRGVGKLFRITILFFEKKRDLWRQGRRTSPNIAEYRRPTRNSSTTSPDKTQFSVCLVIAVRFKSMLKRQTKYCTLLRWLTIVFRRLHVTSLSGEKITFFWEFRQCEIQAR